MHPDWRMATELALAQLSRVNEARLHPLLGLVYASSPMAEHFADILELLERRLPQVRWSGACAPGVCAAGAEYLDEPAVAILLGELPAGSVHTFGAAWDGSEAAADRLARSGHSMLLHADPYADDLAEQVRTLTETSRPGQVFGGVVAPTEGISRDPSVHRPGSVAGLSGLAFGPEVRLLSRVTHGCAPVGREHRITGCSGQYLRSLDGRPALDVILEDLGVDASLRASRNAGELLAALSDAGLQRGLLLGIAPDSGRARLGFGEHRVRDILGIDPVNRLLAVGAALNVGDRAVLCRRDPGAARTDLIRICTELREELETNALEARGAHYVSCLARGRHLFGSSGVELSLIQHNLGDLPLVGFFANGEIADGQLHGYTGVLTLFV